MESWQKSMPGSEQGRANAVLSGNQAYISEEISGWLHKHHFENFQSFYIPDAWERLWLVPENGARELERELQDMFLVFFKARKCVVRMRLLGIYYVFLVTCFGGVPNEDTSEASPIRCVAILNRQSGLLQLSDCHKFLQQTMLSSLNSCIGGIHVVFRYDLLRLLWEIPPVIPSDWPFLKVELKQFSRLILGAAREKQENTMQCGNHWVRLRQELCDSDGQQIVKFLGVKITFHDHATRFYRIYENRLESQRSDRYRKIFEAFLALIFVGGACNE